jgi:hypothetical protein
MKRSISAFVAALSVAGCSNPLQSQPPVPQLQGGPALGSRPATRSSWMSPRASKSASLLYVALYSANDVNVYEYKNGVVGALFGQIVASGPSGLCTDRAGNVWIAGDGPVVKYAHGGLTPIKIQNGIKGRPLACAVDNTSGDLAVAVYHDDSNYGMLTSVRIFGKGRQGHNFSIANGFGKISSLAYDNKGNLYVDGFQCGESECYAQDYYEPGIFELAKTASVFSPLTLQGATLIHPTGIVWVNPTLLVADSEYSYAEPVGYKLLIHGQNATVVDTLPFSSAQSAGGLTVRAASIVVPDAVSNMLWTYDLKTGDLVSRYSLQSPGSVVVSQK